MRAFPFIGLACTVAGSLAPAIHAEDAVKITATQITETRSKILTSKDRGGTHDGGIVEITGSFNGVILRLRAEGKDIQPGMRAENVKIIEAVDDTGQKMRNPAEATGMADSSTWGGDVSPPDWANAGASGMTVGQAKEAKKAIDVQIRLTSPSRKATKLARVRGEFDIRTGGSGKTTSFKNLPSLLGKTLIDSTLKDAKLEVTLVDPKQEQSQDIANNVLTLKIKGNLKQQSGKVELLDSQGHDVTRSKTSMSMGGTTTLTYDLKKPLDNTMVLKISFTVGQKPMTVPFDLRDIELP